jgi:DNA repair protein RadD
MAAIVDKPKLIGDIVATWKKTCPDRKTAAFCVDQKHAFNTAEKFRCEGIDFAYVDCDTSREDRLRIWSEFDFGRLRGVTSVGTISYGWDHGICSCLIIARPTNNEGVWRQILGRGGRLHAGKKDFYVLDHYDNTGRLNAFYEDDVEWSLEGKAIKKNENQSVSIATCNYCFATFRTGPEACPFCLSPIPVKHRRILTAKGELERAEKIKSEKQAALDRWKAKQTVEARREKFDELRRVAATRHYKPGWAHIRYRMIYHEDPPREWGHRR